jgi:ATP-dependent DNA ligase
MSKRAANLNRNFPELFAGIAELKPKRFVLDGEILVVIHGRAEFDRLQLRMHPAESRVKKLWPTYQQAILFLSSAFLYVPGEPAAKVWLG